MKDGVDLAIIETFLNIFNNQFTSLYHDKLNFILAFIQRLGYLSRWHMDL
jgi:hypothetical protein